MGNSVFVHRFVKVGVLGEKPGVGFGLETSTGPAGVPWVVFMLIHPEQRFLIPKPANYFQKSFEMPETTTWKVQKADWIALKEKGT
jgi:hypothetical protein